MDETVGDDLSARFLLHELSFDITANWTKAT